MEKNNSKTQDYRILRYLNGLLKYYGVIETGTVLQYISQALKVELSEPDLVALMAKNGEDHNQGADAVPVFFTHNERYFFHGEVKDLPAIVYKQAERNDLTFKTVSEKDAEAANTFLLKTTRDRYTEKIFDFLKRKGWSEEKIKDELFKAEYMSNREERHTDIITSFFTKIDFKSEKELNEFIDTLTMFFNHTPLWILKGWTPAEVLKMNLEPQPQPEESQRQASIFDSGPLKVGRNAPCPCGSGKKYKKCCGSTERPTYEQGFTARKKEPAERSAPAPKESPAPSRGKDHQQKMPVLEEWRALYSAAMAFNGIKCWQWMFEDELFGIQNPETGEIAYCSVFGSRGEIFALNAYRGPEGLRSFIDLQVCSSQEEIADTQDLADAYFSQKSFSVSFENRDALDKKDLAVIKDLGITIRGRKQWPLFRSHEPGYYPWFLTAEECRFLTLILEQAAVIMSAAKNDKSFLYNSAEEAILVCVRQGSGAGTKWVNTYKKPEHYPYTYKTFSISDELLLRKIQNIPVKKNLFWEADTSFTPMPVQDNKNERPYYPILFLLADCRTALIMRHDLITDIANESYRIIDGLVATIKSLQSRPQAIYVAKEETYLYLEKACAQMDVDLLHVEELKIIPEIKKELNR